MDLLFHCSRALILILIANSDRGSKLFCLGHRSLFYWIWHFFWSPSPIHWNQLSFHSFGYFPCSKPSNFLNPYLVLSTKPIFSWARACIYHFFFRSGEWLSKDFPLCLPSRSNIGQWIKELDQGTSSHGFRAELRITIALLACPRNMDWRASPRLCSRSTKRSWNGADINCYRGRSPHFTTTRCIPALPSSSNSLVESRSSYTATPKIRSFISCLP